jgi:hypothetical protein
MILSGYFLTSRRLIFDTVPFGPEQTGSPGLYLPIFSFGYTKTRPATAIGVSQTSVYPMAKPKVSEITSAPG